MRTSLPAAALAAAALAFGAPAASADYPTSDCDWQRLAPTAPSTGTSTYEIAMHGYAYLLGDVVTIRCYVEVDGVAVFSTPTLPGPRPATARSRSGPAAG